MNSFFSHLLASCISSCECFLVYCLVSIELFISVTLIYEIYILKTLGPFLWGEKREEAEM